jgi:large subunit ribosomal protein L18e
MKKTGPKNQQLRDLIVELKSLSIKENVAIWKRIATDLERSTRQRRIVNISKINHFTKENDTIIVPGKVLGTGTIKHKLNVCAFSFSDSAKKIITDVNGKVYTIQELMNQNPKGKNIKIIG